MALLQKDGTVIHGLSSDIHTPKTGLPMSLAFPPGFKPESLIRPFEDQMKEARQRIIESALILSEGDHRKAANGLRMSYRNLFYHLKQIRQQDVRSAVAGVPQ